MEAGRGPLRLRIFGGEPLLHPEIVRHCVQSARSEYAGEFQNLKIDMTTNGLLLDGDVLELFARDPGFELILSVDPEKNFAGGRLDPRVEQWRSRLLELPACSVNLTVAPGCASLLSDTAEALMEQGFRTFKILPAFFQPWTLEQVQQLRDSLEKLLARTSDAQVIHFRNLDADLDMPLFQDCAMVNPDGHVFSNNLFATEPFCALWQRYCLGHVKDAGSFHNPQTTPAAILPKLCLAPDIIKSTMEADRALSDFVHAVKTGGPMGKSPVRPQAQLHLAMRAKHVEGQRDGAPAEPMCIQAFTECVRILREQAEQTAALELDGPFISAVPGLGSIVQQAHDAGYRNIALLSGNAIPWDSSVAAALVRYGAGEFHFTLAGHNAALHDACVRAPGDFQNALKGILLCLHNKARVIVNIPVQSCNVETLADIVRCAVHARAHEVRLLFQEPERVCGESKNELRLRDAVPYILNAVDLCEQRGISCLVQGLPFCVIPGAEYLTVEALDPGAELLVFELPDSGCQTVLRHERGRDKAQKCDACLFAPSCPGPWAYYLELFGAEELEPVS